MRLNPNIYKVAESNFNELPEAEKNALLTLDITKQKEEIIYFRERSKELLTRLAEVERSFEQTKKEFSNALNIRKDTIEGLRGSISEIDKEIKAKLNEHSDYILEMEVEHQKVVSQRTLEFQTKMSASKENIARLQHDVDEIEEFEREKATYDARNNELDDRIKIETRRAQEKQDMYDQEVHQIQEAIAAKASEGRAAEIQKSQLEEDCNKANRTLQIAKIENQNTMDEKRKKAQKIADLNREQNMQALVSNDCLAEYQALNFKQAKKIKSLKSELQYIKYSLSEELYKFSAQIEELKKQRAETIQEYQEKFRTLDEHTELKDKELRNLRFLAKATLQQKSLVDNFLMESIEYTKTMAALNPKDPNQQHSHNPIQRSEIKDLSWEDKEKVLRVIYSKICLGVSPSYWKKLDAEADQRRKLNAQTQDF